MQNKINDAIQAIKAGDKQRAHALLLDVIKAEPENVLAWLWMGEVYSDFRNKKDCYVRVLQIDPNNELALAHLKAIKLKEASNLNEAGRQLDRSELVMDTRVPEKGTSKSVTKPKKKSTVLVFVILFLVLVLAGAVAYVVLDKQGYIDRWFGKETPQAVETKETETATEKPLVEEKIDTPEPVVVIEENTATPTATALPTETFTATPTSLPTSTPTPIPTKINYEPTMPTPDPRNLVKNGYFLDGIDGWDQEFVAEGGQGSKEVVDYENSYYKRALYLKQERGGVLWFYQQIPVSTVDLDLTFTIQASTYDAYHASSGLFIIYYDQFGQQLGWTRIFNGNSDKLQGARVVGDPQSMRNSPVSNNYFLENKKVNKRIGINLKDEIEAKLLGIDINDVATIELAVYVYSDNYYSNIWSSVYISEIELLEH